MREIRIRIDNLNNLGLSSEVWSCSQSREVRADEWVSVYPPFFLKAVHGLQFCSLITPEAKPRESWVWDLPGRPSETSCSYPPKSKAKQTTEHLSSRDLHPWYPPSSFLYWLWVVDDNCCFSPPLVPLFPLYPDTLYTWIKSQRFCLLEPCTCPVAISYPVPCLPCGH